MSLFLDIHSHDVEASIDWQRTIDNSKDQWNEALLSAQEGKRILIASMTAGFSHRPFTMLESTLAVALTLRQAKVEILSCNKSLHACLKNEIDITHPSIIKNSQQMHTICKGCALDNARVYDPLRLLNYQLDDFITFEDRESAREIARDTPVAQIKNYKLYNMHLGQHAYAGALRYFSCGDLSLQYHGEAILIKYFESALLVYYGLKRLFECNRYESVLLNHGVYVPQGIIVEVCRHYQMPVVVWNVAYRENTFIFSHHDTYHKTMAVEPLEDWENISWTECHDANITNYLLQKRSAQNDWIQYQERDNKESFLEFAKAANLDLKKPIVGLLSNVIWDAQIFYESNIFPDMLAWVEETIKYFSKRSDLQLLIRIHPAEIRGTLKSRQLLYDEINKKFKELPPNIFIINSSELINTYEAMDYCNAVLIYGTKTGVELAAMGKPVIVAGEAWIRNKKISHDPSSIEEYFALLDQLPFLTETSSDLLLRAKKYAFHYFFRRMIPLPFFSKTSDYMFYKSTVDNFESLLPGKDNGLDLICAGILEKKPFIYPEENIHSQIK